MVSPRRSRAHARLHRRDEAHDRGVLLLLGYRLLPGGASVYGRADMWHEDLDRLCRFGRIAEASLH